MSEKPELLPCPWCGETQGIEYMDRYDAYVCDCGVIGPDHEFRGERYAFEAWNFRYTLKQAFEAGRSLPPGQMVVSVEEWKALKEGILKKMVELDRYTEIRFSDGGTRDCGCVNDMALCKWHEVARDVTAILKKVEKETSVEHEGKVWGPKDRIGMICCTGEHGEDCQAHAQEKNK